MRRGAVVALIGLRATAASPDSESDVHAGAQRFHHRSAAHSPAVPEDPVELTVYGLRPLNLTGLVNKNTGDPAGDLFFYLTDRFVAPFACRFTKGRWWACHEQVCVCARARARVRVRVCQCVAVRV